MAQTTLYEIMRFFDNIDDMINNFIDRMELTPVQIGQNLYITGFRRSSNNYASVEAHLKQIRKIQLENINAKITDEGGWYMMEPDGEMWVDCNIISNDLLKKALDAFITNFSKLQSFHLMLSKWKDEGENLSHVEVSLFENKRVACKEALAMRKIHRNVTNKFEMYNNQGDLIEGIMEAHEPTDFELITCKVE